MAEYDYIDDNGHQVTIVHRMLYTTAVICKTCGDTMRRKPNLVGVSWGGLSPSQGAVDKRIRNLIDTAPERRESFDIQHAAHEQRGD